MILLMLITVKVCLSALLCIKYLTSADIDQVVPKVTEHRPNVLVRWHPIIPWRLIESIANATSSAHQCGRPRRRIRFKPWQDPSSRTSKRTPSLKGCKSRRVLMRSWSILLRRFPLCLTREGNIGGNDPMGIAGGGGAKLNANKCHRANSNLLRRDYIRACDLYFQAFNLHILITTRV